MICTSKLRTRNKIECVRIYASYYYDMAKESQLNFNNLLDKPRKYQGYPPMMKGRIDINANVRHYPVSNENL